jgi:hypothetical protein
MRPNDDSPSFPRWRRLRAATPQWEDQRDDPASRRLTDKVGVEGEEQVEHDPSKEEDERDDQCAGPAGVDMTGHSGRNDLSPNWRDGRLSALLGQERREGRDVCPRYEPRPRCRGWRESLLTWKAPLGDQSATRRTSTRRNAGHGMKESGRNGRGVLPRTETCCISDLPRAASRGDQFVLRLVFSRA